MTTRPRLAALPAMACAASLIFTGCGREEKGNPYQATPAPPVLADAATTRNATTACTDVLESVAARSVGTKTEHTVESVDILGKFEEGHLPGHPPVQVWEAPGRYMIQPSGSSTRRQMDPITYDEACRFTPAHEGIPAEAEWNR